jgi:hypothetical protein
MLLIEANYNLRLDRAISQPSHDSLLNVRNCSRGSGNLSSVRDVDATLLIDGLRRQIDEVARARSRGSSWCEQSARGRFKNRYVQDVTYAHDLGRLCALIGE